MKSAKVSSSSQSADATAPTSPSSSSSPPSPPSSEASPTSPCKLIAPGSKGDSPSPAAMSATASKPSKSERAELKTSTAVLLLVAIFTCSALSLLFVYWSFPHLDPEEAAMLKFPRDIAEAKTLGELLSRYKDKYYAQVLGGVFVTYLFLQTFAIPGSIFLSIVSGFLFPFPVALSIICFCSATGASFCYLLSYLVGRRLVRTYLPERSAQWSDKVDQHRDNLLSYIIFLRITPFLPNWFINIVSPVIDVDLRPFWLGTFLGVAPPSFVAIQAGTTLQEMTSTTDAVTPTSILLLIIFAILSILPVIFRDSLKSKMD